MAAGKDTVRIFNNASNGTSTDGQSRVLWIHLDSKKHKATLVKADAHPDKLSAGSQGNAEALPRRHTFVGWGQLGRVSEFDRNGHLLFDATLPSGYDTYRGFRSHWTGTPNGQPTASVTTRGDRLAIHAIWNGATEVRRWRVLAGPSPTDLKRSTTVAWDGLDTRIVVNLRARYVALQALDRLGHVIGTSSVVSARG
jgi:hypothetical protein